ncbi:hypothetical protein B9P99_01020, partial [Candidatus Marsarchaeota G1 archaeon OSP_B]
WKNRAWISCAKGLRCDDALVADGSIRVAGIAANGCMRFSVKVIGKAAHASRNWLGINAIEKASVVVQALTELNKKLSSRLSSVPADPESGVKVSETFAHSCDDSRRC